MYRIDQPFLLRIVKKLKPEYFEKIVSASHRARFESPKAEDKVYEITMLKTVYEKLMAFPHHSRKLRLRPIAALIFILLVKKGRAAKYLKVNGIGNKKKPRQAKKYQVLLLAEFT